MTDRGDMPVHLVAGQLAALTRLGALRDLDLEIIGIDQIFGGDAEAARSDLLDRRAHRIAILPRAEAIRLLAALTGVGADADAVHRQTERRVRLPADRTEDHLPGRAALHDLAGGLHFVDRTGRAG